MLVFKRSAGSGFVLSPGTPDETTVTVLGGTAKIGIEAPPQIRILRSELQKQRKAEEFYRTEELSCDEDGASIDVEFFVTEDQMAVVTRVFLYSDFIGETHHGETREVGGAWLKRQVPGAWSLVCRALPEHAFRRHHVDICGVLPGGDA